MKNYKSEMFHFLVRDVEHTNTAPIEANEEVFNFSDRISLGNILSNNILTT